MICEIIGVYNKSFSLPPADGVARESTFTALGVLPAIHVHDSLIIEKFTSNHDGLFILVNLDFKWENVSEND